MIRFEESRDEDGYRSVHKFDDAYILETSVYRPTEELISRVEYAWDFSVSRIDPISWKEYDGEGHLKSSAIAVGFDSNGIYSERIFYDQLGSEKFRKPR